MPNGMFGTPAPTTLTRGASPSPSSYVEEVARRQWESLKKSRPRGRARSRDSTPSRPTPSEAAAEIRQRMDEKRSRSRSRSRDAGSENSDINVSRTSTLATRGTLPVATSKSSSSPSSSRVKRSSILAAAERKWEDLHSGRGSGSKLQRTPVHGRVGRQAEAAGGKGERADEQNVSGQGEIPQHIITLLVQVCGPRGTPQDQAAEKLRDLMHDRQNAKLVAQEDWPLEALARPLIDGTDRSRVACAACFRHLALDSMGGERILQSPLILTALVTVLLDGDDQTRQKAAAALGNLAWRSEASRQVIMSTTGVMDGLLLLLRCGPPPGRESALAALSNLTLNQLCTSQLARAPEALSELVGEMLTGSAKGQLRAAGIMRNLAAKPENCEALLAFPGVVPVLERLAHEAAQGETRQRAARALQLMKQQPDDAPRLSSRAGTTASARGRATPMSLSRSSSPGASAASSPGRSQSRSSSPPASAALAGRSRRAGTEAATSEKGGGWSGARRTLMATKDERASPRLPVNSFSRRSASRGRGAREAGATNGAVAGIAKRTRTRSADAMASSAESGCSESEKPIISSTSGMSSPAYSSAAGLSGEDDADNAHDAHDPTAPPSGSKRLHVDLVSALLEAPATPTPVNAVAGRVGVVSASEESKAVEQVLQWIAVNGWEGIQERLFDLGDTDYSVYAKIEPQMMAVSEEKGIYLLKGHQVLLMGDRHQPTLLLDIESKRVLWDVEAHTKYTFPLARKYMLLKHDAEYVHILLKSSGKAVARSGPELARTNAGMQAHSQRASPRASPQATTDALASPGGMHAMLHKPETAVVGLSMAESPGPVPRLASPSPLHDPPSRSAAALAKNPTREGALNTSGNLSPAASSKCNMHASVQRGQDSSGSLGPRAGGLGELDDLEQPAHGHGAPEANSAQDSLSEETDEMVEVKLSTKGARVASDPQLWRALMTEGVRDDLHKDTFIFRGRRLTAPTYSSDGLATVKDVQTGEVLYAGPGRHEVFAPTRVAAGVEVVKQLMAWANVHGWHDLSRRLLEQGTTDYSKYAAIDQEMQAAGSSDAGLYSYRGRKVRLFGASRWDPERLEDLETGEILWDVKTATKLRFPWARQALTVRSGDVHVEVRDRISNKLLVKLELACGSDLAERTEQHAPEAAAVKQAPPPLSPAPPPSSPGQRGPQPPGAAGAAAAPDAALVGAVVRLKEWAEQKGWFELESRLINAGTTDYGAYGEMERHMQAVVGRDGVYSLDRRLLQVVGHRLDPVKVLDIASKEVIWDAEAQTVYENPWARHFFAVRVSSAAAVQVIERQTGALVVQIGGGTAKKGAVKDDPLILQSILMDAVPVLQRPGLERLLQGGNKIVQVLKAFAPSPSSAGAASSQTQLSVEAGALLLVTHSGAKGWQLGRLVDLTQPDPLTPAAKEGWFPATYAAPVQELANWRGRVIHIGAPEPDGLVTVSDTATGNTVFQGHPEAPREEWNVSNPAVFAALGMPSPAGSTADTPRGRSDATKAGQGSPRVCLLRQLADAGAGSPRGLAP